MEMEMLSPVKNGSNSSRFPFTSSQWQELEHQALVYKYMISGMPIPPDLLFSIKRSLDCSTKLILHNHSPLQSIGWNCFQMGFGRKIDPEPGRCRRTDGKKWRCSKDAYLDSKYCERHMHRGRNRSRKPVESSTNHNIIPTTSPSLSSITTTTKQPHHNNPSSTCHNSSLFGYPQVLSSSSSSRSNGINNNVMSSHHHQDGCFLMESSPYSSEKQHSYGMKEDVDEHPFLSKSCGSGSISVSKQPNFSDYQNDHYSYLQLQNSPTQQRQNQDQRRCYDQLALKFERKGEPQKIMHHFFDESPHNDNEDNNKDSSTTQLSMSIPSFAHDFFLTHNDK